ncbi:MAG TPA: hypothetical protein VNA25_21920 [Phycisphaerae bacterium]|nr:hypothetical protein [Phycisphaerae bacterium]
MANVGARRKVWHWVVGCWLAALAGCDDQMGGPVVAPTTMPAGILTCPFDATVYELRLPPERVGELEADALSKAAASPAGFEKALARLGQAKLLYRADQSVRLSGDRIVIGSRVPFVTNTRRTATGQTINVVQYRDVGAIFNVLAWPESGGGIRLELGIEVSAMTDSPVRIASSTRPAITIRKPVLTYKGSLRPGRPAVIASADSASLDASGRSVAYLARIVMGKPR